MEDDIFILDDETLGDVELGISSLIHQLGKMCKVVYEAGPDSETLCPNCNYDPTSKRSTNIYKVGGPKPFASGKCPVCKGRGVLAASGESEDIVQLLINWQPKPWNCFEPDTNVRLPKGIISAKGFIADMPKIIQAKYIIVDYANVVNTTNRFITYNEPIDQGNIVKNRFFTCLLTRYAS